MSQESDRVLYHMGMRWTMLYRHGFWVDGGKPKMRETGCWPKWIDVVQDSMTRTRSVLSLDLWIICVRHLFQSLLYCTCPLILVSYCGCSKGLVFWRLTYSPIIQLHQRKEIIMLGSVLQKQHRTWYLCILTRWSMDIIRHLCYLQQLWKHGGGYQVPFSSRNLVRIRLCIKRDILV